MTLQVSYFFLHIEPIHIVFRPKKKELCLSFLKVKTLSAMHFFFVFLVKKGYADAEISPNFFFIAFFGNYFFSRPLRGRFLTFFSISREKKMKKLKISQKPKKKEKKCGKFGFKKKKKKLCAREAETDYFFSLALYKPFLFPKYLRSYGMMP